MFRPLTLAAFAAALATALAATPALRAGGNTPQQAFEAAKAAYQKGDFKAFAAQLSPATNDALAGAFLLMHYRITSQLPKNLPPQIQQQLAQKLRPLTDALARHKNAPKAQGNVPKLIEKLQQEDLSADEIKKALAATASPIKSRSGFVADFFAAIAKLNPNSTNSGPFSAGAKLTDVQINGKRASAKVSYGGKTEDFQFVQSSAGWLIEMPDQVFERLGQQARGRPAPKK